MVTLIREQIGHALPPMVIIGALLSFAIPLQATNYTWTGDGGDTLWANPYNWNPSTDYPRTSSDNATISDASSDRTITTPGAALSINALKMGQITAGVCNKLSLGADLTVSGVDNWTSPDNPYLVLELNGHKFTQAGSSSYSVLGCPITVQSSTGSGVIKRNGYYDTSAAVVVKDNVTAETFGAVGAGNWIQGTWGPNTTFKMAGNYDNGTLYGIRGSGPGNLIVGDPANTHAMVVVNAFFPNYINAVQRDVKFYSNSRISFNANTSGDYELRVGGNFIDNGTDNATYDGAPTANGKRRTIVFCGSPVTARTVRISRTGLVNDFRVGNTSADFGNVILGRDLKMDHVNTADIFEIRDNSTLDLDNWTLTCRTFLDNATGGGSILSYTVGASGSGLIVCDNLTLGSLVLNIRDSGGGLNPSGGTVQLFTYNGVCTGPTVVKFGNVPSGYEWDPNVIIADKQVSVAYSPASTKPPIFTPESIYTAQYVTIRCDTPNAIIRYTTDGNDPTETYGALIASGAAILVDHNMTLKARAWSDLLPSSVKTVTYTIAPMNENANLITDASFESPVPLEIIRGENDWVDKIAADAHQGTHVLTYRSWSAANPAVVLQAPFVIEADNASFNVWIRTQIQPAGQDVTVTFSLYDNATVPNKLMDLASHIDSGSNAWTEVGSVGFSVTGSAKHCPVRLGFTVSGPAAGCTVDVDQAGLFEGIGFPRDGVDDNAEFHVKEAEDLANGTSWLVKPLVNTWDTNVPISGAGPLPILGGSEGYAGAESIPAVWNLTVGTPGAYRVWFRFYHTYGWTGEFTVTAYQNGNPLADVTINEADVRYGTTYYQYVWDSLDMNLATGPVEIRLTRPSSATSWVTRRLDVLCLTNDLSYDPDIMDFLTPAYVRFTNTATGGDSFSLYCQVAHAISPYYTNVGMVSKAGENQKYLVSANPNVGLEPGQCTPWIRINPYLSRVGMDRIQFIATRNSNSEGYVTEPLVGRLDFAVGDNHSIVKSIEINQAGPIFRVRLPGDIATSSDNIATSWDCYQMVRAAVDANQQPSHPPIRHLSVSTGFILDPVSDDHALYTNEIQILTDMGMNNLFKNNPMDKASYGLLPTSGAQTPFLLTDVLNGCFNQPNWTKLNSDLAGQTALWAEDNISSVTLFKVGDEVFPNTLDHVVGCSVCTVHFAPYLQSKGLTLAELAISDWSQAVPKGAADRDIWPALYYYTQMFRLDSFRGFAKTVQDAVTTAGFPNAQAFNNCDPAGKQNTWMTNNGGEDIFISVRNGMGMGWSEDWGTSGAGPMLDSYVTAMLRTACRPENKPFGMHVIVRDGPSQTLRTKLYETIAGGATYLDLFLYGPAYTEAIDSWSLMTDRFPAIMETLAEFGRIDNDLYGTTRRSAQIAVLYNRTAGIWEFAGADNSWEMDAQFTYWALRHAGYDADILPEEDVERGDLDRYNVLYISGECIRKATADNISAWLNGSSHRVLVGMAGAGTRDEYNHPINTLHALFGISESRLTRVQVAGRPKYEIPALTPLSTVTVQLPSSAVSFDQLAWKESLTVATGTMMGYDASNNAVAVRNQAGENTAFRFGFLPGLTYLHEAWKQSVYDNTTPIAFPEDLREVIAYGASAAGVQKTVQVDRPDLPIELTRYDAVDGSRSLIFVVNHHYDESLSLNLTIPNAGDFIGAYSARRGPLGIQKCGDNVSLALNMDRNTDVIVLQKTINLQGTIHLGDFTGNPSQIPVAIEIGANPVQHDDVMLDDQGRYLLSTSLQGTFSITAKASHWLRQRKTVTLGLNPITVDFTLTNGDWDGDNEVTSTDLAAVLTALNEVSGGSEDLNGDGQRTSADLAIILANLDVQGED